MSEDYTELSTPTPSTYAKVITEQTGKGTGKHDKVSSPSTITAHYEHSLNAGSSDLDRTYSEISDYINS